MLGTLVSALLLCQDRPPQLGAPTVDTVFREKRLTSMDKGTQLLLIRANVDRLPTPKKSPLNEWPFEWISYGLTRDKEDENFNLRIRVYNQFRKSEGDPTDDVLRLLMRLWDFNRWRLNSDHNAAWHQRSVDVYLCAGGNPGAEQLILEDPYMGDPREVPRVNNIYVYSVTTLEDRMEFAREVAHEYGHATWPGFGEFTEPESWASGDMAERVFMLWLLRGMQSGKLKPDDVMGATIERLVDYYDYRTRPDLKRVGLKGPDMAALVKKDRRAYSEIVGLCSYSAAIMPPEVFGRSIWLATKNDGPGFAAGVVEAASRVPQWKLTVPRGLENVAIWVPLRAGRVTGAKELGRKGDWVKVQPTSKNVTVINSAKPDGT